MQRLLELSMEWSLSEEEDEIPLSGVQREAVCRPLLPDTPRAKREVHLLEFYVHGLSPWPLSLASLLGFSPWPFSLASQCGHGSCSCPKLISLMVFVLVRRSAAPRSSGLWLCLAYDDRMGFELRY